MGMRKHNQDENILKIMCFNEGLGTDLSQGVGKAINCSENFLEKIHSVTALSVLPRVYITEAVYIFK